MTTISIIVSAYNRADYLSRSINNWLSKPTLPDKILVIDDRSKEDIWGAVDRICQQHPERKDLFYYYRVKDEQQDWRNPGICHNFGVKQCGTDHYAIIDPETVFVSDCIGHTKSWLDGHPRSFVNAGIHYETNMKHYDRFDPYDIGYVVQKAEECLDPIFPPDIDNHEVCYLEKSYSHALAAGYTRNYIAMGGKDERMTGYGWEDSDFHDRMFRNDFTHDTINEIAVIHVGHTIIYPTVIEITDVSLVDGLTELGVGGMLIPIPIGFPADKPEWEERIQQNLDLWAANTIAGLKVANEGSEWGVLPIEKEYRW